ncbi:hypothetical protein D9M68_724730 [compost metagenome]
MHARAVPRHPPGQDERPRGIDQRVDSGNRGGDAQGFQRFQRVAAQQLPGRQAAHEGDGKRADVLPDHILALRPGNRPDQRHHDEQRKRRGGVTLAAQRRCAVHDEQITAEDDEIGGRRAERAGHLAAEQRRRAAQGQRGEPRRQDPQRSAAFGMGPMLPERKARRGEQRSDDDEVKSKEIDVHREREVWRRRIPAASRNFTLETLREDVTEPRESPAPTAFSQAWRGTAASQRGVPAWQICHSSTIPGHAGR